MHFFSPFPSVTLIKPRLLRFTPKLMAYTSSNSSPTDSHPKKRLLRVVIGDSYALYLTADLSSGRPLLYFTEEYSTSEYDDDDDNDREYDSKEEEEEEEEEEDLKKKTEKEVIKALDRGGVDSLRQFSWKKPRIPPDFAIRSMVATESDCFFVSNVEFPLPGTPLRTESLKDLCRRFLLLHQIPLEQ